MNFKYYTREDEEILDDILEAIADGEKIQGIDLSHLAEEDKTEVIDYINNLRQGGIIDIDAWDYERQYDTYDYRNEE